MDKLQSISYNYSINGNSNFKGTFTDGNGTEIIYDSLNNIVSVLTYNKGTIISESNPGDLNEPIKITIVQGANKFHFRSEVKKIEIEREPFSIEFCLNTYSVVSQIQNSLKVSCFMDTSYFGEFKEGYILRDNPFLGIGTGIAGSLGKEYDYLNLGKGGSHYIFYENEGHKRAKLKSTNLDGSLNLSWTIDSFLFENKKQKIENTKIESFFMVFFIDSDKNNMFEFGEYAIAEIYFK